MSPFKCFPDTIPADIIKTAKDIASRHSVDTTALEREIAEALLTERVTASVNSGALGILRMCAVSQQRDVEQFMRGVEERARRIKAKRAETEGGA